MASSSLLSEKTSCQAWHHQPVEAVLAQLNSLAKGLSALDATQRLAAHGPNEIKEGKRISPLQIFLGQFKSLIIWILLAAGVISGLLGELVDMIAILAIVVLNAVIGFYQEYKAEQSIAALKMLTAPHAKVRRDGLVIAIAAKDIVVGDILVLEAGDLVVADARLLEAASLKCIEAALTGESNAVTKQTTTLIPLDTPLANRENMVFMGTSIAAGQAQAVVVATAMETELGHIAGLIEAAGADESTPLQQKLDTFGHLLVRVSLGIVALMFALGVWRGTELVALIMTSISLAVAAVPEGLPAVVTIALALGVLRMSRRAALVRKLSAVETLGSTNVICTDKTGTLTVGEMTVRQLYVACQTYQVTGEGYGPEGEVLLDDKAVDAEQVTTLRELTNCLVGCNNAHLTHEKAGWKVIGDPTEGAMLTLGAKAGVSQESIDKALPKQHEIPFDSDRKRSSVIRRMPDGKLRALINGAPDVLLQLCTQLYTDSGVRPLTEQDRQQIGAQNSAMAQQALRVLGSAYRDLASDALPDKQPDKFTADTLERDLVFVGLTGLYDPPRPECKTAVAKCRAAGIGVVMITGDHPHTAMAIARELGIASNDDTAIAGAELDKLSDAELQRRAPQTAVYARVTAEHKLRIVRAWQANDAVVAMTGDGVNDAPAIKGANIGIAMGKTGTEVTKQASDIIITDDNFASIVAAVEEGRGIYDNIRKTLLYLLSGNAAELLLMAVCVVIAIPVPLLPIHLLWINLVTDGLPALCLAIDPIDADVMQRKPRRRSENITDQGFLTTMFVTGLLTAGITLGIYLYALQTGSEEMARTQAFAVLVFAELLRSFGCRSETKPFWRISIFTNITLLIVVATSLGLQVWSHHSATLAYFLKTSFLSLTDCLPLFVAGAVPLVVLDIMKVIRQAKRQRKKELVAPDTARLQETGSD